MLEVDVTEEAKQVALYRYELTGELYDDDEILISCTTTSPSWSRRSDEITFESWLEEMISFTNSDDTSTGSTRQRGLNVTLGNRIERCQCSRMNQETAPRTQLHGILHRSAAARPVVPL